MKIPQIISRNVIEAYRCSNETKLLPIEINRSIQSDNENWDENIVPELRKISLNILAENWIINPVLDELENSADRDELLELLSTNIPLDIIIKKIPDECYWSRAAKARWQYNNPGEHGNSWRRLYCERHLAEFIEKMDNDDYHKNECDKLIDLVAPYIKILNIRSLIPFIYPVKVFHQDDDDINLTPELMTVHHVQFENILIKLPELCEIHINFGVIYMNDGFEWRDFEFSVEDCLSLGKGIKNSLKLVKITITRSNLDQPRVAALLHGVVIQVLDLSHCKLGDTGAHAIGEFLRIHKRIKELHLVNNGIGPNGLAGIVHGLLQDSSAPLKYLNLRLNPLRDEGGVHICALLLRISSLEKLNVSGCCFNTETGLGLAEVLSSGFMKILYLSLNLSNNDLGHIAGEAFNIAIKNCKKIVELDMRMCNFKKESEFLISKNITRNKEEMSRKKGRSEYERRRSSAFIPLRAKSLLPPAGFEDVQKPQQPTIGVHFLNDNLNVHFDDDNSSTITF
ncbi:dynein regulatory complex subunit 5 isoform X2 [Aphidius gifuensis]|uniref:dynein regulatory complex subunit 5 isoform X2 n=1 Tax=Aphidius gifuensis TaxID=684658 RepID=UPI001CDC8A34|nr:dynein regulatory complex subunit 5 isoform X2 [Aphidius gifuensis]